MKFKYILLLSVFALCGLSACSDDEDGDDGNVNCNSSFSISAEVQAEVDAFTAAATAYGMNPTPENCEDYRDAANAYLDAILALEDCADEVGLQAEFTQSVDAARASVNGIQC